MKRTSSGAFTGTTPELKALAADGYTVRSVWCDFELVYQPRNTYDPQPWVSHGGTGFRYNAREVYAEAKPEPEPTLEDYAKASRIITSLMPGVRR